MKLNHTAQIQLDTVLENCVFYILTMYEFSHSLDPKPTVCRCAPVRPAAEGIAEQQSSLPLPPGLLGDEFPDHRARFGAIHPADRMASVAHVCLPSNKVSAFPVGRPIA